MRKPLTTQQLTFVDEYLLHGNATAAAIKAKYSKKTAAQSASRLLNSVKILDEIDRRQNKQRKKFDVTAEDILNELKAIGFSRLGNMAQWGGSKLILKDSSELAEEDHAAIESVTETPGAFGIKMSVKTHNKVKALELLAKRLGLFKDEEKPKETPLGEVVYKTSWGRSNEPTDGNSRPDGSDE